MAPERNNDGFAQGNRQPPMEPASSILAAHFAPLAPQGQKGRRLPRETFSQLRQELLGEIQSQMRVDEGITDINKLICIVLKAGLEVDLTSTEPTEDLLGQIIDCLDIIQASIEKAPQALWEISDPLIMGEDIQAPLFAWLILRLIRLAGAWSSEFIHHRTHLIFSSMASLQSKQARSSPLCYGISAFLHILCTLETSLSINLREPLSKNLFIPATNGSLGVDLDNLALPRGLIRERIDLGSFSQAIILVSLLLDSFSPQAAIEGIISNRRSFNLRQNLPWVLNGYNRLRQVAAKWVQKAGPTLTPEEEQDTLEVMAYIHRFCVSDTSGSALRSDVCLASTWAQCLSDILPPSISSPLPVLQTGLIHFLEEALQAAIDSNVFAEYLRESFLSVFAQFKDKDGNFLPMEPGLLASIKSLEVVLLDVSRLAEYHSKSLPAPPAAAGLADVQKPGISTHEMDLDDDTRAPKRMCLPVEPSNQGLLHVLTEKLSALLNCDKYGGLADLRTALIHSVVAFVHPSLQPDVRRANFVVVLEWLKNISEKNDIPLQEACVLTLCCLAKFSDEEEKNIILLRLVEYLGHPNPYICAVAYDQLSKLAFQFTLTPAGLFRPYWRTLSVAVVKNLQTRPYMAEQLCELLGMKVDSFLRLTEVHVLPYLVLTRKRDIICRIGASRDEVESPFDVCSEKNNLAAILAFLLAQESSNPEAMIMSLLAEIDPAFKGRTLAELVRIEPILIACDLLKSLGDAGEQNKERFHQALRRLASFVPRKSASHGGSSKKADLLSHFIEEHVLGIITQFSNAINDFQVRQTLAEKRRNLKAIEEMISIAQGHVSNALPQVCACLRSALDMKELCGQAFSAWTTLISSLSAEDIEPLIDQTFAIVIRYWDRLTDRSRKHAHQLIDHILTNHPNLVRDTFDTMPSLASIPEMAPFEAQINELRAEMDVRSRLLALIRRCQSENGTVVEQALAELLPFLSKNEEFLHVSALSEQPDPVIAQLTRALLDCCVKFNTSSDSITLLSARCLGLIGCLDPNRVETVKEKKDILVLSNFDRTEEIVEFVLFFLQHVLVDAFLSASNTRAQGFLAYAMQGLLRISNLQSVVSQRSYNVQGDEKYQRWMELPEGIRNTLTPFLTSTYTVTIVAKNPEIEYPLFSPDMTHSEWLRTLVQDLLSIQKDDNAKLVFAFCSRVVKGQDISISSFLLPFAVLYRIVGGTTQEQQDIQLELIKVLSHPLPDTNNNARETIVCCSQSVFDVLDYLSRWLQGKKKQLNSIGHQPNQSSRSRDTGRELLFDKFSAQIKSVEAVLAAIPPRDNFQACCGMLQDIYSQIDEPDGIEGISSHLSGLNIEQQVLEHRKAGRWATAQSWYELQLEKEPDNLEAQWNLITCLKESGQQDAILTRFEALKDEDAATSRFLPFAVEASWITSRWSKLKGYLELCAEQGTGNFNVGIGSALCTLQGRHENNDALLAEKSEAFTKTINQLRLNVAKSLTANSVASLQSCHDDMLRLHALADVEAIANARTGNPSYPDLSAALKRRLDVLGGYIAEKQYLLGIRRAAMELAGGFADSDISAAWLTSAHLSRKGKFTSQAYHSMLNAARLKDRSATIEHAKLLWQDGHHRKAIQTLEGAISMNENTPAASNPVESEAASFVSSRGQKQNDVPARAHLMLAKWTDRAGQTHSQAIVQRYREAIKLYPRWEKAHYYLGKHYNKILDSEKAKPMGKEAQIYLSGEATKLVIDNYLRSLTYGSKYVFQTLPKLLTLWLEHASIVGQPIDPKRGDNEEFQRHTKAQRQKSLDEMHAQLKKYISSRLQPALLFTILPQVVARICHPNSTVYDLLTRIVTKAVHYFPQQGLWTVLAVVKSSNKDRASKGYNCLQKITEFTTKHKTDISSPDIRRMITSGQKVSEELLQLCLAPVEDRATKVSLARGLGFNHKVAPCRLVVPFQAMLIPSLPASHDADYLKGFRAFPRDPTTIEAVLDEATILNSLQKPRKISIRGSDGKIYNALCKPKDDLRKDQRLMEFNNMINRFLKRDVEASKRRMYIKTYAVTPLNEECGLIEWVDNLRTLRDIIVKLLRERGISPNYGEIKQHLNEICADRSRSKVHLFTTKILAKLPPVLHEWFIEMFPETEAWFSARLRYTRSAAVMSMVGYVLGLGDRHGENLSFEEGTGGILHVDFNCLFDKGQTFEKPEVVPFRLTNNMIDAFGAYGYNGPFRRTCEITLSLLRQNEDSLMTILETFLHDPTTDFIGKRRRNHANVPDTPAGVLEDVRNKLRGFMSKQPIALSVDGQVDELIMQATDKKNLAAMYIGWCAFF
ncbi:hypothetical protein N7451_001468 [Penicillium sp. IBT 35674x]|nr:hypothetical protein N7451_001468 [Penicillium sp. IBT 35674x]